MSNRPVWIYIWPTIIDDLQNHAYTASGLHELDRALDELAWLTNIREIVPDLPMDDSGFPADPILRSFASDFSAAMDTLLDIAFHRRDNPVDISSWAKDARLAYKRLMERARFLAKPFAKSKVAPTPTIVGILIDWGRVAKELQPVLNSLNVDAHLDTPDYLLSEYLVKCLVAYHQLNLDRGKEC